MTEQKEKEYTWHKIANSTAELQFPANGLMEITVDDKTICIAKNREVLYGCAAKCPHAGGHMSEGYLDVLGNIVCPLHRYKFNLQSGRNISGEGYFLRPYPVEIRQEGVYVGIEKKRGLFW